LIKIVGYLLKGRYFLMVIIKNIQDLKRKEKQNEKKRTFFKDKKLDNGKNNKLKKYYG
jgi:hypothetical protein